MKLFEITDKQYSCTIRIDSPSGNWRRGSWTQKEVRSAIQRVPDVELEEIRGEFGPWYVTFSGDRDHCIAIRKEVSDSLRSVSRGQISMSFSSDVIG